MLTGKKLFIIASFLLLLTAGWIYQNSQDSSQQVTGSSDIGTSTQSTEQKQELVPVTSLTHGHGMAVDISDPNTIYIATHHGLLVLKDDKDLYQVGTSKDDYMGFSPHPTDPKVLFSSGHSSKGGNIGFQKSEDGGKSWKKVSNGVNGPVDFHAMTVSAVNPSLIFGWYQGMMQRSIDEGKNWEIASTTSFPVVNLAADPKNENIVYASSPQGLMVSNDKGSTWTKLLDGLVSVLVVNPQDSQELLSYSEKQKLTKSIDGGKSWEQINADFIGETPLYISFNKQDPNIIYLLTEKNSIYKSNDSATTWVKIR